MHCCTFRVRGQEYLVCAGSVMWYVCQHGMVAMQPRQPYRRRCDCQNFEIYKDRPTWL